MKQKRTNLAAGRLGDTSSQQQESADGSPSKDIQYGVGRLGIASQTEPEPPEQAEQQESSGRQEQLAEPGETSRQDEIPAQMAAEPEPAGEGAQARPDAAYESSPKEPPRHRHRSRPILLLAGAGGGVLAMISVLLVCWAFSGSGSTPQIASAGEDAAQAPAGPGPAGPPKQAMNTDPSSAQGGAPAAGGWPESIQTARSPSSPAPGPESSAAALMRMLISQGFESLVRTGERMTMLSSQAFESLVRAGERIPRAGPEGSAPAESAAAGEADDRRGAGPPEGRQAADDPGSDAAGGKKLLSAFGVCPPDIELSCIMCGLTDAIAIINNKVVRVGQTVNNAKVVRIDQASVELERDGRRFLIQVASKRAARPAKNEAAEEPAADTEPEE